MQIFHREKKTFVFTHIAQQIHSNSQPNALGEEVIFMSLPMMTASPPLLQKTKRSIVHVVESIRLYLLR